jgi:hypothetical protein
MHLNELIEFYLLVLYDKALVGYEKLPDVIEREDNTYRKTNRKEKTSRIDIYRLQYIHFLS